MSSLPRWGRVSSHNAAEVQREREDHLSNNRWKSKVIFTFPLCCEYRIHRNGFLLITVYIFDVSIYRAVSGVWFKGLESLPYHTCVWLGESESISVCVVTCQQQDDCLLPAPLSIRAFPPRSCSAAMPDFNKNSNRRRNPPAPYCRSKTSPTPKDSQSRNIVHLHEMFIHH